MVEKLNFAIVLPVLAVVNAILHSRYYVKNGRYREVGKYFNRNRSTSIAKAIALGIIFFSFAFFIFSGISLGRFLHG